MVRRTRLDLVEIVCIVWLNQHTLEEMHRVKLILSSIPQAHLENFLFGKHHFQVHIGISSILNYPISIEKKGEISYTRIRRRFVAVRSNR